MRILKVIFGLIFSITVIFANPVFISYINEIQTAPESLQRIEIHTTPFPGAGANLSGYWIKTRAGIATINQGTIIPYTGFITIDSTNTSGIFHLNTITDTITIYSNNNYILQSVIFPAQPVGEDLAPAPPFGGSVCLYRSPYYYFIEWDKINWYIDSTPTFDEPNDDWSSISGTILNAQGQPASGLFVDASGQNGDMCGFSDTAGHYDICGLGQGKYWLTVWIGYGVFAGNYPESVYVGYSQNVPNININLPLNGIEQTTKLLQSDFTFITPNPFYNNAKISFVLPFETEVLIKLFDIRGDFLKTILNQKLNAGQHQIRLNLSLVPGVYFLNANIGQQQLTKKLIVVR
jgi:hypothetical protein